MMNRIMFVTGALGCGGAERVISILSDHYNNKGWKVSIVMLLHDTIEYEINPGVVVESLSDNHKSQQLNVVRLVVRLRESIKRFKPDIVVAFMAQICIVSGLACIGLKARLISSERIDPAKVRRNFFFKTILNVIYAYSSLLIVQTNRAKLYFPKRVRRNSIVVPNPVQVFTEASCEKNPRIVTGGRLEKQKNHSLLIRAFSDVHRRYPAYCLDIYGEGKLHSDLTKLITNSGLENVVHLRGVSKRFHEEIADAEIFVLSSDFEGLSNALLEAMMMGLPCISTNCAGSDEVIDDGVTGLLVPVGDQMALTSAMERLISDKKIAASLGQAGRMTATHYDLEHTIAAWEKAIEGRM